MNDWSEVFADALPYASFLDRYATPAQRSRWDAMHERFSLTRDQESLLAGFARRMPVICLAGAWCGDCVNQCPAFDLFARGSSRIDLRFVDRDARPYLRDLLAINGGQRVPVVVFLSEDCFEVARYGERTLSIYRRMAAEQLGPACPTGLVPASEEAIAVVTAEWLAEFERAQLLLRLSPRLRALLRRLKRVDLHTSLQLVQAAFAKRLDDTRGYIEVVWIMREPHLGAKRLRQGGKLLVGRMHSRVNEARNFVDDQVGGTEPLDQAWIVGGVGAEAQDPAARINAEAQKWARRESSAGTRLKTARS